MNLIQLAQCAFGKHHRDRRRARFNGDTYQSFCTGCGQPMEKAKAGWRITPPGAG